VDNKKAFNNLQKRMKWYYDDIQFKKLELDENV
jgi:reverse gyrase